MQNRLSKILIVLGLIVGTSVGLSWKVESAPQNADYVMGTGNKGNIAKWVDTNQIGDAAIIEDSGFVAIGATPSTSMKLFVSANLNGSRSTIGANNTGTGRGVEGSSVGGIGLNGIGKTGVNGISYGTTSSDAAVRGISQYVGSYAGDFWGNVRVTGMLTKGGGSFRIDHPLDPKNKYLSHSFVESPDMMNIYNGNITTGSNGEATVELPSYFEALNRDFRYQLTVVGQFAQAMVLEKIKGNTFRIKTDKPNVEVSWQVTGVRKDKFAEEHRIKVEWDKPEAERGTLQNP